MNEKFHSAEDIDSALTPEALSDILRIEAPIGTIHLRGIARDIRPWSRPNGVSYVYGRLVLGSASIGFRAVPELAPGEGEAVIMKGRLKIEPANGNGEDWRATHRVQLYGEVTAPWQPREPAEPPVLLPPRQHQVQLDELIAREGIAQLAVLATDTARADINRTLSEAGIATRPVFEDANFGNAEEFLATLRQVARRSNIRAIAVSRGGGGGQDVIGGSAAVINAFCETNKPFYTAFGHATGLVPIDKYADQSFHAPSGLGAALARAVRRAAYDERKQSELIEKTKAAEAAEIARQALAAKLGQAAFFHRQGLSLSWPVMIVVVVLIALLVWLR